MRRRATRRSHRTPGRPVQRSMGASDRLVGSCRSPRLLLVSPKPSAKPQIPIAMNKQIVERSRKFSRPYRVTNGKGFPGVSQRRGPRRHAGSQIGGQIPGEKKRCRAMRRSAGGIAGRALRARSLGGAAHLPGDGRRRQRRDHQARPHVSGIEIRRGCQGVVVQGAHEHRILTTTTSGVASRNSRRPRAHRHLQSQLLRRDGLVVRVHPQFLAGQKSYFQGMRHEAHLGRALSGYPRV